MESWVGFEPTAKKVRTSCTTRLCFQPQGVAARTQTIARGLHLEFLDASGRTRTNDTPGFNRVLYHLSYRSAVKLRPDCERLAGRLGKLRTEGFSSEAREPKL